MIPRNGIVLLSRKNPYCASCVSMKHKLAKLKRTGAIKDFQVVDIVELGMMKLPVPQLMKNGTTLLTGDCADYTLEFLKQRLGV